MEFKVIRQKITTRGGGVEIDLSTLGFDGHKMSAYQNYLGGGMLGRVYANDTIRSQSFYKLTDKQVVKLDKIVERLKKYFHDLTNPADQEWENQSYEQNQKSAISAY